jgi:hypothetical protein
MTTVDPNDTYGTLNGLHTDALTITHCNTAMETVYSTVTKTQGHHETSTTLRICPTCTAQVTITTKTPLTRSPR